MNQLEEAKKALEIAKEYIADCYPISIIEKFEQLEDHER